MNIFGKMAQSTLKKNKTRTAVTIIGVILSAAMIMAITTFISSLRNFMVEQILIKDGAWHAEAYSVSAGKFNELSMNDQVKKAVKMENLGYAKLYHKGSAGVNTSYFNLQGYFDDAYDLAPVLLTAGRYPENDSEIIVPEMLFQNCKYKVGDKLALTVGDRVSKQNGQTLYQCDEFNMDDSGKLTEKFVKRYKKTYTVVGLFRRLGFENATADTVVTKASGSENVTYRAFFTLKNPKKVYDFINGELYDLRTKTHSDLLMYNGISNNDGFNKTLYAVAGVLISLIVLGSVSLIYNAFSISVQERIKQFGLMASVGATKKQIRKTIYHEAFIVSLIGIPLGVLGGIGGAAVTLRALRGNFELLLNSDAYSTVRVHASAKAVAVAVIIAFITVMISALIPAKKASKITPIEAVRQTNDIKIGKKEVKTSPVTKKLFGIEGMIASKNFKRNRKKYRSTIVSLTMSIVLFISASSFTQYLKKSMDIAVGTFDYDIEFTVPESENADKVFDLLKSADCVTSAYKAEIVYFNGRFDADRVLKPEKEYVSDKGRYDEPFTLYYLSDEEFDKYARRERIDPADYYNAGLKAIAYDNVRKREGNKYVESRLIADHNAPLAISAIHYEGNRKYNITAAEFAAAPPRGAQAVSESIILIMPQSSADIFKNFGYVTMRFNSSDYKITCKQMNDMLKENGFAGSVYSIKEMLASQQAMIDIVSVFSYGFILLISLISVANVFNTISTNIHLRRREFAMLRSVGMTGRGFNKIMIIECIFYGVKSVIYGLIISAAAVFAIYKAMSSGVGMRFILPWAAAATAVASVFAVVLITMIYAMRKVKKQNTIETIKDDNI